MQRQEIPENRTLVTDPQYRGQYVALADCNDNRVVATGVSWGEARRTAVSHGFSDPVVVYVPSGYRVHCVHAKRYFIREFSMATGLTQIATASF